MGDSYGEQVVGSSIRGHVDEQKWGDIGDIGDTGKNQYHQQVSQVNLVFVL